MIWAVKNNAGVVVSADPNSPGLFKLQKDLFAMTGEPIPFASHLGYEFFFLFDQLIIPVENYGVKVLSIAKRY